MTYIVPQHISNDKIFIVNHSEIEGRLEPEYYRPSIASLEKRIRSLSSHRLKDYALSIAGGATPKKTESDKFYSDSESGIPFLRVQNLQTNGDLSLDDCIYINKDTHNGMLKRSQVAEGDLLVKITGVGRMAIASVAPKGFVGNTNQHMVVIKTGNTTQSKYLARYLNLDIIEKIASRHSTGGTRPALDYSSLKRIPIIERIDFTPIDKAIEQKKEKETEAQKLLNSIDFYILKELGIVLPKTKTELKNRIFYTSYHNILGKRIDPKKHSLQVQQLLNNINATPFETKALKALVTDCCSGDWGIDETDNIPEKYTRCLTLRATEIDNQYNLDVDIAKAKYRLIKDEQLVKMNVSENDIIIEKSGGSDDQPVGRVAIIEKELLKSNNIAFSNFLMKIKVSGINPDYLYLFLKTMYNIGVTDSMQSQTNGIRNLIPNEFMSQSIIVPPSNKQQEIVDTVYNIRKMAMSLQEEGKIILENAKHKIEKKIIG